MSTPKKHTLPEGWEVVPLGQIANVVTGGTPSRAIAEYWDGSIPWITTSEIDFSVIAESGVSSLSAAPRGRWKMN